ncbi:MAG: GNAT family N-acetyltransferase [Brevinematales bacterium]|nr:GNAT family N-acetyltransferase [Brevinematales bacterium]
MIIREAEQSDIPVMVELLGELFSIEKDFQFDREKHARGLSMMMEHSGERVIMTAVENGTVIGMCSGQMSVSTVEGGWSLWIEDMIVSKEFRGKGIGTVLIGAVEKWGKSMHACRLQLLADMDNTPALEFYRHEGWTRGNMVCLRKKLV